MEMSPGKGPTADDERRKAITSAYEHHADGLYRFCLRRTDDETAAQEIAQKVFEEAWKKRGEVDFTSRPIAPWLYAVARNMLRSRRRDDRRREETLRSLREVNRLYAADPSEEVASRQAARALVGSLESLPSGQRQVVSLCLLGDCSYETAAGVLEVPVGTVRSRLYRARLNLALAVRSADGL